MTTNSYLTAAVATAHIDSQIRDAKTYRLVAEARQTSGTRRPKLFVSPTRPSWFPRPATA